MNPNEENHGAYGFLVFAWLQLAIAITMMIVGLWTLKEPLMVKGYYFITSILLVGGSITAMKATYDYNRQKAYRERVGGRPFEN
ncbi:MAG: YiaA/YiaB family inner membrane protein [Rothia sp. (in: high G+C Gram-positive bacteria)]|nr:YiaA/YiaB family inner membrane protein [Rothia sp. (in: high G+C Gram-positive bacteria)]